jgi:predicted kinase
MPSLYIIRGVSGSGKSTFGSRLKAGGLVRYVISADDYMIDSDGAYQFDPKRLKECHTRCQMDAVCMLRSRESVAVCNTFTRIWEMQPYIDMARNMDAHLYVIRCEGAFQNLHGVPHETVKEMRDRFEDWQG